MTDIAFGATIAAAAPRQRQRGRVAGRLRLQAGDLRQKVRERKTRSLLIFVVDGSDSVMARQLMPRMKRALLALLQRAYERRDRVAMLVFRFAEGRVVLPPTRNFTVARRRVEELYIGGCTPLATGLLEALRLAESERLRDPSVKPVLIILTDGLANVDLSGNMRRDTPMRDALDIAGDIWSRRIPAILIDTNPLSTANGAPWFSTAQAEATETSAGRALAEALAADYYQLCSSTSDLLIQRR